MTSKPTPEQLLAVAQHLTEDGHCIVDDQGLPVAQWLRAVAASNPVSADSHEKPKYGSPLEVAARIETWIAKYAKENASSLMLYEAMKALRAVATPSQLPTPEAQREAAARAIWNVRREQEDRCDMELEDMGPSHSVWHEADAVIAALSATQGDAAQGGGND